MLHVGGWFGVVVTTSRPVTTIGGSNILVSIQATRTHSAWLSLHV